MASGELDRENRGQDFARRKRRPDIDPFERPDFAAKKAAAVGTFLPYHLGTRRKRRVDDQQDAAFAADRILGFMEADGRERSKRAGYASRPPAHHGIGVRRPNSARTRRPLRVHDVEIVGDAVLSTPGREYRLYEHDSPNTGGYSPVHVRIVPNVRAALEEMAKNDFDPRKMALVHDPVDGELVPVSDADLRLEKGGFHISARSEGLSMILIPIEYSHCLRFVFETVGARPPRAFRANVNQTAILFEHSMAGAIRLEFGPFVNRGCRYQDLAEARRLEMGSVQGWWPH